jgi:hypothetical protein
MLGLLFTMVFFGMAYAGDDPAMDMSGADAQVEEAAPAPQSADMTIAGTINESNQLIDATGKAFELSESTDEGLEVKALIGQKVELKGTVMEENGAQVIDVKAYKILGE